MKKIRTIRLLFLINVGLFIFDIVNGQTVEKVFDKDVDSYEGKSYEFYNSVTLKPGFSFSTNTGSSFYIKAVDETTELRSLLPENHKVITELIKVPGIKTNAQVTAAGLSEKQTIVTYTDGLDRTSQQIDVKGSPQQKDIIQLFDYDISKSQTKQYLPYVSSTDNGSYQSNAIVNQAAFYQLGGTIATDSNPFQVTKILSSSLGPIVEQGNVGVAWQPGSGHAQKSFYRVNTTADAVINWTISGPSGTYAEQDLSVAETTSEQGNKSMIFTDKFGRVLLKKEQLDETITEGGVSQTVAYLETYYVYDALGNLIYQVSPKATAKIKAGAIWDAAFKNEWIFQYTYDDELRITEKKTPGKGKEYIVYDQLNRPVLSQDAKNRTQSKWYFTKYDLTGKPVTQGLYTYTELYPGSGLNPHEQLQKYYNELNYDLPNTYYHEKRQAGTTHGYSNQAFPISNLEILTVNYYDDYDFDNDGTADHNYVNPGLAGAATAAYQHIQGSLTGNKKLVIGSNTWLTSVVFYDEYGRAIEKRSNNHLYNSTNLDDLQALVYEGFSTAPKLSKQVKNSSSSASITVNNRYEYDHRDRMKTIYQSNNGSTEQLVGQYLYNELGQVVDRNLHGKSNGSFLQSIDYRYNIRGWLTSINNSSLTAEANDNGVSDLFGLELAYNNTVSGLTSSSNVRYDGRISAVRWKTNDVHSSSSSPVTEKSYRFNYDKTGRLKEALYTALNGSNWNAEVGAYDEKDIKYDHNGNILALKRYALYSGSSPILIDNLSYTYTTGSGNQLKSVEDASGQTEGFKENSHEAEEYIYDENGNLISDKNKGDGTTAMNISYNELNKTSRVDLSGGRYILYTYAATGERLRKETHGNGSVKTTDYVEGFVYENTILAYFPMAEGRVRNAAGTLKYEYNITDQQGNVRVSFAEDQSGNAEIIQENHYYPFGLAIKGSIIRTAIPVTANKNLYNGGSELQDDFGDDPNVYSTFFREYDPVLGRMNGVDPMADKYGGLSPYVYSSNDPINLNDPSGGDWDEMGEVFTESDRPGYTWNGTPLPPASFGQNFFGQFSPEVNAILTQMWNLTGSGSNMVFTNGEGHFTGQSFELEYSKGGWGYTTSSTQSSSSGTGGYEILTKWNGLPSSNANLGGDDTFWDRLKDLPRAIWDGELDNKDPNLIQTSMGDNPISFFMPFGQISKASLGYKTLGGASKTTLITTAFFKEMGISGSLGGRWFTPLGSATNWETFLGRWMPFFMESGLIYEHTKDKNKK